MCLCASVQKESKVSVKSLCACVLLSKKNLCAYVKNLCASVYKKGEKVQKKWGRNIFVKWGLQHIEKQIVAKGGVIWYFCILLFFTLILPL